MDNFVELVLSTHLMWVPVIQFSLPRLQGKHIYPLRHSAGFSILPLLGGGEIETVLLLALTDLVSMNLSQAGLEFVIIFLPHSQVLGLQVHTYTLPDLPLFLYSTTILMVKEPFFY